MMIQSQIPAHHSPYYQNQRGYNPPQPSANMVRTRNLSTQPISSAGYPCQSYGSISSTASSASGSSNGAYGSVGSNYGSTRRTKPLPTPPQGPQRRPSQAEMGYQYGSINSSRFINDINNAELPGSNSSTLRPRRELIASRSSYCLRPPSQVILNPKSSMSSETLQPTPNLTTTEPSNSIDRGIEFQPGRSFLELDSPKVKNRFVGKLKTMFSMGDIKKEQQQQEIAKSFNLLPPPPPISAMAGKANSRSRTNVSADQKGENSKNNPDKNKHVPSLHVRFNLPRDSIISTKEGMVTPIIHGSDVYYSSDYTSSDEDESDSENEEEEEDVTSQPIVRRRKSFMGRENRVLSRILSTIGIQYEPESPHQIVGLVKDESRDKGFVVKSVTPYSAASSEGNSKTAPDTENTATTTPAPSVDSEGKRLKQVKSGLKALRSSISTPLLRRPASFFFPDLKINPMPTAQQQTTQEVSETTKNSSSTTRKVSFSKKPKEETKAPETKRPKDTKIRRLFTESRKSQDQQSRQRFQRTRSFLWGPSHVRNQSKEQENTTAIHEPTDKSTPQITRRGSSLAPARPKHINVLPVMRSSVAIPYQSTSSSSSKESTKPIPHPRENNALDKVKRQVLTNDTMRTVGEYVHVRPSINQNMVQGQISHHQQSNTRMEPLPLHHQSIERPSPRSVQPPSNYQAMMMGRSRSSTLMSDSSKYSFQSANSSISNGNEDSDKFYSAVSLPLSQQQDGPSTSLTEQQSQTSQASMLLNVADEYASSLSEPAAHRHSLALDQQRKSFDSSSTESSTGTSSEASTKVNLMDELLSNPWAGVPSSASSSIRSLKSLCEGASDGVAAPNKSLSPSPSQPRSRALGRNNSTIGRSRWSIYKEFELQRQNSTNNNHSDISFQAKDDHDDDNGHDGGSGAAATASVGDSSDTLSSSESLNCSVYDVLQSRSIGSASLRSVFSSLGRTASGQIAPIKPSSSSTSSTRSSSRTPSPQKERQKQQSAEQVEQSIPREDSKPKNFVSHHHHTLLTNIAISESICSTISEESIASTISSASDSDGSSSLDVIISTRYPNLYQPSTNQRQQGTGALATPPLSGNSINTNSTSYQQLSMRSHTVQTAMPELIGTTSMGNLHHHRASSNSSNSSRDTFVTLQPYEGPKNGDTASSNSGIYGLLPTPESSLADRRPRKHDYQNHKRASSVTSTVVENTKSSIQSDIMAQQHSHARKRPLLHQTSFARHHSMYDNGTPDYV